MKIKLLMTVAVVLHSGSALASAKDVKNEIALCSQTASGKERLRCFDDLSATSSLDLEKTNLKAEGSVSNGAWDASSSTSPVDDSTTILLSLSALNPVSSRVGGVTPRITIRCKQNQTDFIVHWSTFINNDDTAVLTRIDKDKAQTTSWNVSTDYVSTFARNPIPLIKSMQGKSTLIVGVTPHSSSPLIAEFDITGIREAIKPLRKTCNW